MKMTGSAGARFGAAAQALADVRAGALTRNTYRFHFKADKPGGIKVEHRDGRVEYVDEWTEEISNLTTTEGRTDMLQNQFKGSSYSAAFYMFLVSNTAFGAFAVGDTMAKNTTSTPNPPTTNDWAESIGYSEGTRPAITFSNAAAASIDNAAAPVTFTINTSVALYGGGLGTNSTKGGTTGLIYGLGAFSSVITLSAGTVTVYCTLTVANA